MMRWWTSVKFWAFVIWVVAFVAGLEFVAWHAHIFENHTQEQFVALKTLQVNHRIVDGDIAEAGLWHPFLFADLTTRDDFDGRYVKKCVSAHDPVGIEQTVTGPNLVVKRRNAIVWISLADLPAADIATLDVHRTLDVCNIDGQEKCGTYAVEAIACSGKDMGAATCQAGVQVTLEQRRRLFLALDKAEAPLKREASPKPGTSPEPDTSPAPTIHLMIHRPEAEADAHADTHCPSSSSAAS